MRVYTPSTPGELTEIVREAGSQGTSIELAGSRSKRLWAGPIQPSDVRLSTLGLNRLIHHEKNDLTVSVEAGLNFGELQSHLRRQGQMIALDPPCQRSGTVGGVLAANVSGPLRGGYGTARDLVIGMTFATLEGRLVTAGGMVVKNVAGLDMAKLMIGSFGTLAIIVSANFRIHPIPEASQTWIFSNPELANVIAKCTQIMKSCLRPVALDLLNPPTAARVGLRGFALAIRAAGSKPVLARFASDLRCPDVLEGKAESQFWKEIREFTPSFLQRQSDGVVLRAATRFSQIEELLQAAPGPTISRVGSGVTYLYLSAWPHGKSFWKLAAKRGWRLVVEAASDNVRGEQALCLPGSGAHSANTSVTMEKVKSLFDPKNILNRSRLYGRL